MCQHYGDSRVAEAMAGCATIIDWMIGGRLAAVDAGFAEPPRGKSSGADVVEEATDFRAQRLGLLLQLDRGVHHLVGG